MRFAQIFFCILLLAGCSHQSPTEIVSPFEPGVWAGTFRVVTVSGGPPLEGTISFLFKETTYSYTGRYANIPLGLEWTGSFKVNDGLVRLQDQVSLRMVNRLPSLYFNGDYRYSLDGSTLTISKADSYFPITLSLKKQVGRPYPF